MVPSVWLECQQHTTFPPAWPLKIEWSSMSRSVNWFILVLLLLSVTANSCRENVWLCLTCWCFVARELCAFLLLKKQKKLQTVSRNDEERVSAWTAIFVDGKNQKAERRSVVMARDNSLQISPVRCMCWLISSSSPSSFFKQQTNNPNTWVFLKVRKKPVVLLILSNGVSHVSTVKETDKLNTQEITFVISHIFWHNRSGWEEKRLVCKPLNATKNCKLNPRFLSQCCNLKPEYLQTHLERLQIRTVCSRSTYDHTGWHPSGIKRRELREWRHATVTHDGHRCY